MASLREMNSSDGSAQGMAWTALMHPLQGIHTRLGPMSSSFGTVPACIFYKAAATNT